MSCSLPVRLVARTTPIDDPGPLDAYLGEATGVAWLRRGDGLVGLGEVCRLTTTDASAADTWWREFCASLDVENALPDVAGTGPLMFGSLAFDPGHTSSSSIFVVPGMIIGRRDGRSWLTRVFDPGQESGSQSNVDEAVPRPHRSHAPAPAAHLGSSTPLDRDAWRTAVARAIDRLDATFTKVVMARAVDIQTSSPIDQQQLVRELSATYPTCWTFCLDGLVGASPEMLVRRDHGLAMSRVLAGTIRREGADETDHALARALAESSKNLAEHEFSVASVASALARYCTAMNVPDAPSVLQLPNVLHLASDITGVVQGDASALDLAIALHPTAAVCGTPTDLARATIAELEGFDRGRYAGPVGWQDAAGDGEFAIALRCGQIDQVSRQSIRLYAGCGIVDGSDPAEEYEETQAKLIPMEQALGL